MLIKCSKGRSYTLRTHGPFLSSGHGAEQKRFAENAGRFANAELEPVAQLPPVGVFMKAGATKHLFINIVLCLLFFVRGIIHGVWVVTR